MEIYSLNKGIIKKISEKERKMSLKPVGSIFDMSVDQIDFYSTRLYPNNQFKGYWSFSSVKGFLHPNENLLQRGYSDLYQIESNGVTHNDIVRKLIKICSRVMFGEFTDTIDEKFRVWRTNSTKEFRQLCPFTPRPKERLNPFEIPKTCGQNNFDFIICNMNTKRYVIINSLLMHLICDHRFFEGEVHHRINPLALIEFLEIEKKTFLQKQISQIESNCLWKPNLQKVYSIETPSHPLSLSSQHDKKMHRLNNNVVGIILPYRQELDPNELVEFKNHKNLKFLHLFNLGHSKKTVSGYIEGASFKNVTIPSNKRIVLVKIRCNNYLDNFLFKYTVI